MAGFIVVGTLAAFGLMCAVWILWGLAVRPGQGGVLVYAGTCRLAAAQRYIWLRELGLVRSALVILDPEDREQQWLEERGIEICSREELAARLGIGEIESDGTGTGDPAGRHRRCGISEL